MISKDAVAIALRNAAESQVLETLVLACGGFIVASRDVDDPTASRIDLPRHHAAEPRSPLRDRNRCVCVFVHADGGATRTVHLPVTSELVPPDPKANFTG